MWLHQNHITKIEMVYWSLQKYYIMVPTLFHLMTKQQICLLEQEFNKPLKVLLQDLYKEHDNNLNAVTRFLSKYNISFSQLYYWYRRENIQYLTREEKCRMYNIDESFFEMWTPEMAWVFGLLIADGCITTYKGTHRQLLFDSTDLDLVQNVRNNLKSTHKIFKFTHKTFNTVMYCLRISRAKIYNDLVKLGMTERKSLTMKFPNIPDKYLSHFVRGYTDGDGSITKRMVTYSSGSKQFLVGLRVRVHNLNFSVSEVKTRQPNPSSFSQNPCYILLVYRKNFIRWLYKGSTHNTRLDRKYKRIEEILQ